MIGVFDSGFGGLTILKAFRKDLPDYDYVYLGDNARTPYGNKSQEVIYAYTRQAVEFLFDRGCALIILACNTASTEALRKIQQEYLPVHHPDRRVLGVVIPLAEAGVGIDMISTSEIKISVLVGVTSKPSWAAGLVRVLIATASSLSCRSLSRSRISSSLGS